MRHQNSSFRLEPVVLLTFANDRYNPDGQYLRNLVAERQAIESIFEAKDGHQVRLVVEQNLTAARMSTLLARHGDAIIGVHFGGHADQGAIHVEDNLGRAEALTAEHFAGALAHLPRLRWVFLNGCSTAGHRHAIQQHVSVPLIGTSGAVRDDIARDFAFNFYSSLHRGKNLGEAYQLAQEQAKQPSLATGHSPQAGPSRLLRPAAPSGRESGWLLTTHPDSPKAAEWTLPGEMAMFGVAGRLAVPSAVRLPRGAVSRLLIARHEVVPFDGRYAELAELEYPFNQPRPPDGGETCYPSG